MFGLSNLLSGWWKIAAIAAIVLAIWGHGYYTRDKSADKELSEYQFQVAVAGGKAQAEEDAKYIEQLKKSLEQGNAYRTRLNSLRAELSRVRKHIRPDGSEVPTIPAASGGTDGAGGQCVPVEDYRALEARAAEDALKIDEWQKWAESMAITSR